MAYMLLIVEPQGQRVRPGREGAGLYQRMLDFAQTLQSRGVLLGVNSLKREVRRD